MAFHEQYDSECPACGARISATAPKCISCGRDCGRFVDEDEEAAVEATPSGNRWIVFLFLGLLVVVALAALYFG